MEKHGEHPVEEPINPPSLIAQIFSQKIWSFLFRRRTLISEFIFFFITSSLSQRELTNARKGVRPYPFPNRAHSRGRAQKVETTSQACTTRKSTEPSITSQDWRTTSSRWRSDAARLTGNSDYRSRTTTLEVRWWSHTGGGQLQETGFLGL